jgi:hypothetical protein
MKFVREFYNVHLSCLGGRRLGIHLPSVLKTSSPNITKFPQLQITTPTPNLSRAPFPHRKKIRFSNSNIRPPKTTKARRPIAPRLAQFPSNSCSSLPYHKFLLSVLILLFLHEHSGQKPAQGKGSRRTQPKRTNRTLKILLLLKRARRLATLGILLPRKLQVALLLLWCLCLFPSASASSFTLPSCPSLQPEELTYHCELCIRLLKL